MDTIELNTKQSKLLEFVKEQHGDQVRKYTGEPYWTHPLDVAKLAGAYDPKSIEIALCHDLFEDTKCDFSKLHKELVSIGYVGSEAYKICTCVKELTDVFTHEDYPYMNRFQRKRNEALRLGLISGLSQTVKYADLINNGMSIVKHDKEFATVYLVEMGEILECMINGNVFLYRGCITSYQKRVKELTK